MNELKPCPFCGGVDVEIIHCEDGCCGAKPRLMECKCGCSLWVSANNDKEAIETWNTRHNDVKWIRVEDEPKENGHYQIWDNGYGEGIFRNGEWKSTDRPIKNAMGVQCLRVTLHPTYYMPLPAPPKQLSEGE